MRQGESGDEFFILLSGSVDIVNERAGKKLNTLTKGAAFGEAALEFNQPRSAGVHAICDVALGVVGRGDYQRLLHQSTRGWMNDTTNFLAKQHALRDIHARELQMLSYFFERREYSAKTVVASEGSKAERLILLYAGEGRILASHRSDRSPPLSAGARSPLHGRPNSFFRPKRAHSTELTVLALGAGQLFGDADILASKAERCAPVDSGRGTTAGERPRVAPFRTRRHPPPR